MSNEIGMKLQSVGESLLHIQCEITKEKEESDVDKNTIQKHTLNTFGGGYLINIDQTEVYALIDIVVYGGSFEAFTEFKNKMEEEYKETIIFASASNYKFSNISASFIDNGKSFFKRNK